MPDCTCNNFPLSVGNVTIAASLGIGAYPPAYKLDVFDNSGTYPTARIASNTHTYLYLQRGGVADVGMSYRDENGNRLWSTYIDPTTSRLYHVNGAGYLMVCVTQDGKVGIGTPAPEAKLHLYGSAADPPNIKIQRSDEGPQGRPLWITRDGLFKSEDVLWLRTETAHDAAIGTGGAEKVRITADGKVGIGVNPPAEKLEVNGNVKGAGVVISQAPGADASLQRDVEGDYLAISGGKTRRGPTSGGLIQLMGNARAQNPGSVQYILGEGAASPRHIFYDNGPDATVQEIASIDNSGNASFNGNVTAANNVRARETGWFAISALQEVVKDNPLGVIPKGITVFCASPTDQSEVTVAGPTVAHWHDWGGSDYGAFLRVTATQIRVRAGNYVGWHSGTWQTTGYYNIVFWA